MELIKKELLMFNRPIKTDNFGTIYQPTLRDFLDNNLDINALNRSFGIKKELILSEESSKDMKNFDIFLLFLMLGENNPNIQIVNELVQSLMLLYRTDNVKLNKFDSLENAQDFHIVVNDTIIINRDNYDDLCRIISVLLNNQENNEETIEALSEMDLLFEKAEREFKKKCGKDEDEKSGLTVYDLANYIVFSSSKYTYETVLDLTIYQIKTVFNTLQLKENYKTSLKYRASGQFDFSKEPPLTHWFFNKE